MAASAAEALQGRRTPRRALRNGFQANEGQSPRSKAVRATDTKGERPTLRPGPERTLTKTLFHSLAVPRTHLKTVSRAVSKTLDF